MGLWDTKVVECSAKVYKLALKETKETEKIII